mmetsp:Transcript_12634/g.30026  ORF Transcript_12634/g.30026 Transcript_12634/m.30026 type:complete len:222 (-) Transcript_12634:314-979(-)
MLRKEHRHAVLRQSNQSHGLRLVVAEDACWAQLHPVLRITPSAQKHSVATTVLGPVGHRQSASLVQLHEHRPEDRRRSADQSWRAPAHAPIECSTQHYKAPVPPGGISEGHRHTVATQAANVQVRHLGRLRPCSGDQRVLRKAGRRVAHEAGALVASLAFAASSLRVLVAVAVASANEATAGAGAFALAIELLQCRCKGRGHALRILLLHARLLLNLVSLF